jgi:formate dehydrogenase subunit delta
MDALKLLRMAEQIAANVTVSHDVNVVAERTADHLVRFWDPRMRADLLAYVDSVGPELSASVQGAVERLREATANR